MFGTGTVDVRLTCQRCMDSALRHIKDSRKSTITLNDAFGDKMLNEVLQKDHQCVEFMPCIVAMLVCIK
jgi:hypothetical protein